MLLSLGLGGLFRDSLVLRIIAVVEALKLCIVVRSNRSCVLRISGTFLCERGVKVADVGRRAHRRNERRCDLLLEQLVPVDACKERVLLDRLYVVLMTEALRWLELKQLHKTERQDLDQATLSHSPLYPFHYGLSNRRDVWREAQIAAQNTVVDIVDIVRALNVERRLHRKEQTK